MKNILIIYLDQLRRDVLGCYGGKEVETPNIDLLAREGILMDECYTPSAVCTPSRGCFLTGTYPHNNGAVRNGMAVKREQRGIAEAFLRAGYSTGYVGKWHLAGDKKMGEDLADENGEYNRLGFENWKYRQEINHCKSIRIENGKMYPSDSMGNKETYTTDWLTDETIRCLKNRERDKPFLFMTSIPDPHQPFEVRKPYDTMFDPLEVKVPKTFYEKDIPDWADGDEWGRQFYFPLGLFEREGHLRRTKAQYLGMVKCIDDNVGKIIRYLKEEQIWEETMVILTTDHGEYLGEHGLMGKNNLYDSAYHIPMIISMPWEKQRGVRSKMYFSVVDFGKTIAGMAGISYPYECDGYDKSDSLFGNSCNVEKEIYIHPSDVPRAGIITDQYELAYVGTGWKGKVFCEHILFDRIRDPYQEENLFSDPAYQSVITELTEKIRNHHKIYKTPKETLPREVW